MSTRLPSEHSDHGDVARLTPGLGRMQPDTLVSILLSAAALLKDPLRSVAAESVKDLYSAAKYYLRLKFGAASDAAKVFDLAVEKPGSPMRHALLVEETTTANLHHDPELVRLIEQLAAALPASAPTLSSSVHVNGHHNRVEVAGRDIVHTERHVQRNVITPDERHIDGAQKRQLAAVINDVADRLAGADGRPRFAAVHKMLQRKFNVSAFALLPRDRFDEAMAFLRQQRAIHRASLRRRNPTAYAQDFSRIVRARCSALGWDEACLHKFATKFLGLKSPLRSLRELGPVQLKSLARALAGDQCEKT